MSPQVPPGLGLENQGAPPPTTLSPTEQANQLAAGWQQHIHGIDPQQELPDEARAQIAEQYYQTRLLPFYLQNGYNPEAGHEAFKEYAKRPGQTNWPLLGVAAREAVGAFAQPLLGAIGSQAKFETQQKVGLPTGMRYWMELLGIQHDGLNNEQYMKAVQGQLEDWTKEGVKNAVQAGRGPLAIGAAEFVGQGLGMLPYAPVFGAAQELAESAGATHIIGNAFAGATFGGLYEYAKTQGNIVAGLKGAATGAAFAGGLSVLGHPSALWEHLANNGVEEEVAKSIEKVAKGLGEPMDYTRAANELAKNPRVTEQMHQWLADQIKAANAHGIPQEVVSQGTRDRLVVTMRGADGKAYVLGGIKGMPVSEFQPLVSRIVEHLQAGGKIERLSPGGGPAIQSFLAAIEKANAEKGMLDLEGRYGGATPDEEGPKVVVENDEARGMKPEEPAPEQWEKPGEELRVPGMESKVPGMEEKGRPWQPSTIENDLYFDQMRSAQPPAEPQEEPGVPEPYGDTEAPGIMSRQLAYRWAEQQGMSREDGLAALRAQGYKIRTDPTVPLWEGETVEGLSKSNFHGVEPEVPPLDHPAPEPPAREARPGLTRGSAPQIGLNDVGNQQTLEDGQGLAKRFGNRPVTISADTTARTQETAKNVLTAIPDAQVLPPNPAWESKSMGSFEGGPAEQARTFDDALLESNQFQTPAPGTSKYSGKPGESWQQTFQRVIPAATEMMQNYWQDPEAAHLQVTHSTNIRVLKAWLDGEGMIDPKDLIKPDASTGGVFQLRPKEGVKYGSVGPSDWELVQVDPQAESKLPGGQFLMRHGETDWNPVDGGELSAMGPATTKLPIAGVTATGVSRPRADRFRNVAPPSGISNGANYARSYMFKEGSSDIPQSDIVYNDLAPQWGERGKLGASVDTLHHENTHVDLWQTGLSKWFRGAVRASSGPDSFVDDVFNGSFDAETRSMYQHNNPSAIPEEIWCYLSGAARARNWTLLNHYAKADTDLPTTLEWIESTGRTLLDKLGTVPDSIWKRDLQRRIKGGVLPFVSKHLDDLDTAAALGDSSVLWSNGHFQVHDVDGIVHTFSNRESLLDHLTAFKEPYNAPELVDSDRIPAEFPMPSVRIKPHTEGIAPIGTDPPPPELTTGEQGERAPLGLNYLSGFVRPFYDWISTVSQRVGMPELAGAFDDIHQAFVTHAHAVQPYMQELMDGVGSKMKGFLGIDKGYFYNSQRQTDFMNYVSAQGDEARAAVVKEFRISPEEQEMLNHFIEVMKPTGFMDLVHRVIPQMAATDFKLDEIRGGFKGADWHDPTIQTSPALKELLSRGTLDPRDTNLTRVAATYLRGHFWHEYLEKPVEAAEDLLKKDKGTPSNPGERKLDILHPLLNRQLEYYRGVPDNTTRVVQSAVQTFVDFYNHGIEQANPHLPEWLQMEKIEQPPKDILQKWITFGYAGALGVRPSLFVRDAMTTFTTGFPVLGGKYLWKGMEEAFKIRKEGGTESSAFKIAMREGWLLRKDQLGEMIAGGGKMGEELGEEEEGKEGIVGKAVDTAEKYAQRSISYIQFVHNVSRLAIGWGAHAKITDALGAFAENGDRMELLDNSGFRFVNKARRDILMREAASVVGNPEASAKFALRAAKDIVDSTQWNYTKGAQPMLYKYAAGRLLGQYGTWPLNYIEYMNRLAHTGSWGESSKAFGRLVLSHGATLLAAQSVGIDAGKWFFTSPMAYGGGPIYQAVTNIPGSLDFESSHGTESRRQLVRMFWPGIIPGGEQVESMYEAIRDSEDGQWMKILGFNPIDERKKLIQ